MSAMGLWKERGETGYGDVLCEDVEFWNAEPNIAFFIELKGDHKRVSEQSKVTHHAEDEHLRRYPFVPASLTGQRLGNNGGEDTVQESLHH